MSSYDSQELLAGSPGRTPVTCAACGCRLEAASGARDGEYHHFQPFGGRDARGCRVDCVALVHDASGRAIVAQGAAA
jgi:hypothetical protein